MSCVSRDPFPITFCSRSSKYNPFVHTTTTTDPHRSPEGSQRKEINGLSAPSRRRPPPPPPHSSDSSKCSDGIVTSDYDVSAVSLSHVEVAGEPHAMSMQQDRPTSGEYSHVVGNSSQRQNRNMSVAGYLNDELGERRSGKTTTLATKIRQRLSGLFTANGPGAPDTEASQPTTRGGVNVERSCNSSQRDSDAQCQSASIGSTRFADDDSDQSEANASEMLSRQKSMLDELM